MNKVLLPLLAMFLLVGCSGGDDPLGVSDMAGTYSFTKATAVVSGATVTMEPPLISGTLTLGTDGRYTIDITIADERLTESGTYTVSEPNITFFSSSGAVTAGSISDDGRKLLFSGVTDGMSATLEFTRA